MRFFTDNEIKLKGCFVEGTFTTRNLGATDIKKLVDEVNKIRVKRKSGAVFLLTKRELPVESSTKQKCR